MGTTIKMWHFYKQNLYGSNKNVEKYSEVLNIDRYEACDLFYWGPNNYIIEGHHKDSNKILGSEKTIQKTLKNILLSRDNKNRITDVRSLGFNSSAGIKQNNPKAYIISGEVVKNKYITIDSSENIDSPLFLEYIYKEILFRDNYDIVTKTLTIDGIEYSLILPTTSEYIPENSATTKELLYDEEGNIIEDEEDEENEKDIESFMYTDIKAEDGTVVSDIVYKTFSYIPSNASPPITIDFKYNISDDYITDTALNLLNKDYPNKTLIEFYKEEVVDKEEILKYNQNLSDKELEETKFFNIYLLTKEKVEGNNFILQKTIPSDKSYTKMFSPVNNTSSDVSYYEDFNLSLVYDLTTEEDYNNKELTSYNIKDTLVETYLFKCIPIPNKMAEVEEALKSLPSFIGKYKDSSTGETILSTSDLSGDTEKYSSVINLAPIRYSSILQIMPEPTGLRTPTNVKGKNLKRLYEELGYIVSDKQKRKEENFPPAGGKSKDFIESFKNDHPVVYEKVFISTSFSITPLFYKACRSEMYYFNILRGLISFWEKRVPVEIGSEVKYYVPSEHTKYNAMFGATRWNIHMYKKRVEVNKKYHRDTYCFFQANNGNLWICIRTKEKGTSYIEYGLNLTYYYSNIGVPKIGRMQLRKRKGIKAKWKIDNNIWMGNNINFIGSYFSHEGRGGLSYSIPTNSRWYNFINNTSDFSSYLSYEFYIPKTCLKVYKTKEKVYEQLVKLVTKYDVFEDDLTINVDYSVEYSYIEEKYFVRVPKRRVFIKTASRIQVNFFSNRLLTHLTHYMGTHDGETDILCSSDKWKRDSGPYYKVVVSGTLSFPIDRIDNIPIKLSHLKTKKSGISSAWEQHECWRFSNGYAEPPFHIAPIPLIRALPLKSMEVARHEAGSIFIYMYVEVYQPSTWGNIKGVVLTQIMVLLIVVLAIAGFFTGGATWALLGKAVAITIGVIGIIGASIAATGALAVYFGANPDVGKVTGYVGGALTLPMSFGGGFWGAASLAVSVAGSIANVVISEDFSRYQKNMKKDMDKIQDELDGILDETAEISYDNFIDNVTPEGMKDKSIIQKSDINEYFTRETFLCSQEGVSTRTYLPSQVSYYFSLQNSAYDYNQTFK